jgi:ADP-ribosylation factor-like protein 2
VNLLDGPAGEDISTISPTLGFQINTMEYKGHKLNIWDVGGQQTIRAYWRNYFETTEGLIWVVDSSDTMRLEDCRRELQTLLGEEKLAGASLLIFANKQDIPGALPASEIEAALKLGEMGGRAWCQPILPAPFILSYRQHLRASAPLYKQCRRGSI